MEMLSRSFAVRAQSPRINMTFRQSILWHVESLSSTPRKAAPSQCRSSNRLQPEKGKGVSYEANFWYPEKERLPQLSASNILVTTPRAVFVCVVRSHSERLSRYMPTLNLKASHNVVKAYYDTLKGFTTLHLFHEGAVSPAFAALLRYGGRQYGWTLAETYVLKRGNRTLYTDGSLLDDFKIV